MEQLQQSEVGNPVRRVVRPKYQVFISSTWSDLRVERSEVTWEILKSRHIPSGMEIFPATHDRGWEIIQKTIDHSDYYILLVAGLYGSIDPSTGISWTEREYQYAVSRGLPVLSFLRNASSIPSSHAEKDRRLKKKLDAFIGQVKAKHLCKHWDSVEDLKSMVSNSLRDAIADDEDVGRARPGWYRGSSAVSPETLEELARLSRENADLRSQLQLTKYGGSVKLELVSRRGELLNDSRPLTYDVVPSSTGTNVLRWDVRLRNVGDRVCRNIIGEIVVEGASAVYVGESPSKTASAKIVSNEDNSSPYFNVNNNVYVSRRTSRFGVVDVGVRIATLGVDQTERLPILRLEAPAGKVGSTYKMKMNLKLTGEQGEKIVVSLPVVVNFKKSASGK